MPFSAFTIYILLCHDNNPFQPKPFIKDRYILLLVQFFITPTADTKRWNGSSSLKTEE